LDLAEDKALIAPSESMAAAGKPVAGLIGVNRLVMQRLG